MSVFQVSYVCGECGTRYTVHNKIEGVSYSMCPKMTCCHPFVTPTNVSEVMEPLDGGVRYEYLIFNPNTVSPSLTQFLIEQGRRGWRYRGYTPDDKLIVMERKVEKPNAQPARTDFTNFTK
jgi:hypothetical protein